MYRADTSEYYAQLRPPASHPGQPPRPATPAGPRQGPPPAKMITRRTRLRPRLGRTLANMTSRRSVVDYGLARRATLASVFSGRTTVTDVCDAQPYLLRAAKFHGEPTDDRC